MSPYSLTVSTLLLTTTLLTVRTTVSRKSHPVVYVRSGRGVVSSPYHRVQKKSEEPVKHVDDVERCRNQPCQSRDTAGEETSDGANQSPRCSTPINGLKEFSQYVTPSAVRSRVKKSETADHGNAKLHLASNLAELVVRRSIGDDVECERTIIHQEAAGVVPKRTLYIPRSNTSSENKKKAIIGSNPEFKSFAVHVSNVLPQKRLTITSATGTKKTLDSKNSISSLIAAVKARENLTTKTIALVSNGSSDSVKKGSLADVYVPPENKATGSVRSGQLEDKLKPAKVADAGKSILAAIDDKEGLRAALAKAIDRVEKVVANKNGALVPRKVDNEKKNDTKSTTDIKGADMNKTAHLNSTEATNTTATHETGAKATDVNNNSTGNSTAAAPTEAPKPPEKDPYAEIAMGPDKPKIPELKGEDGDTAGPGALMKVGDQNVQPMAGAVGGGGGGGIGGAGGGGGGDGKPLAGMHDVGGLLDSLTDKVNLADTKGFTQLPISAGVRDSSGLLDQSQEKPTDIDSKGLVQQSSGTGVQDPGGMLDRAQEKFNQLESKGETPLPGVQEPGGLLDRATEKFNRLGGGIATDAPPMDNQEVKYIQSQLGDGTDEQTNKMAEKMHENDAIKPLDEAIKPLSEPVKPMGADDAMKALTGDDISEPNQAFKTNTEAIKTLQKDDTYNPMLKPTMGDSDEDGSMKGMKEDVENADEDMHKMEEESAPSNHKDTESSEGLVKDILDKASSLNPDSKGGGDETFKELQGADISAGPDPYANDKEGAESYTSMYGGGQNKNKFDEDTYGDMPNEHEMNDGIQGFAPHTPSIDSYSDGYEKNDFGSPREGIESNEEPQTPARARARGSETFFSMGGNDNDFTSRQNIPTAYWSGSRVVSPNADSFTSDTFNDNYNTQMFKKNVIMRPERDYYVSPFNGKDSFEIDL